MTKSTTAPSARVLPLLLSAQRNGKVCAVLDMGRTFDLSDAKQVGIKTAELLVSQPENHQQATDIAETLAASGSVGLIVCCQFTATAATLAAAEKTDVLVVHDSDILVRDDDDMLALVSDVIDLLPTKAARVRESKQRVTRMAASHKQGHVACETCGRAIKETAVVIRDEDGKQIGTAGPDCARKMRTILAAKSR